MRSLKKLLNCSMKITLERSGMVLGFHQLGLSHFLVLFSLKNLRKICKSLGEKIPDDEMAAMIDEFDRDNDGEINKEEFFNIVKAPQDL
mmetsp:Transcript_13315/g.34908  ORF Transcript_13315/g.34908 Transcript_13315/m.34908 type:complete len:89 (+) Transcript_13315:444-710(+)